MGASMVVARLCVRGSRHSNTYLEVLTCTKVKGHTEKMLKKINYKKKKRKHVKQMLILGKIPCLADKRKRKTYRHTAKRSRADKS